MILDKQEPTGYDEYMAKRLHGDKLYAKRIKGKAKEKRKKEKR